MLYLFENATGQQINFDKSSVLFSLNTLDDSRQLCKDILGVDKVMLNEKYLGLPLFVGRSNEQIFQGINDRLPFSCRESYSYSISCSNDSPSRLHHMYCYRLPKEFLHELNMIQARFWWGGSKKKRKIHWRHWDSLCMAKLDGGLGFKDFKSFNLALLASQWWRVMNRPESLAFKVLRAKYFFKDDPMKVRLRASSSFLWRNLMAGREVVARGSLLRVGNDTSIDVWSDR